MNERLFYRRLALWAVVCPLCAVPSFIWAIDDQYDIRAMACGVGVFVLAYAVVTSTDIFTSIQSKPFVRRTLLIGFGTRLGLTVAFPLGLVVDLIPGMISTSLVRGLVVDSHGFLGTLLTTLLQGVLVNSLLAVFVGVVYLIQLATLKKPTLEGFCRKCRYNLTGNVSGICPECGTEIPPGEFDANCTAPDAAVLE